MAQGERKGIARRYFLQLLGLGVGIGLVESGGIEPRWVEVTHHTVHLPDLPYSLDGLVLAQLTDLHCGPITPISTIRKAIRLAAQAKPDLVLLTGDFVHWDTRDAERLAPLLLPLGSARLGVYGCLGNHDYGDANHSGDAITETLTQEGGVSILRNENQEVSPGLFVAGIEDITRGRPNTGAALQDIPDSAAVIFLTHNPVGVFGVEKRSCLALAGHTHGGQIRIPFLPPKFPPGMHGFPLIAGWGTFHRTQLYINRGVGLGGIPFRFRCRPEIAIITLRRGDRILPASRHLDGYEIPWRAHYGRFQAGICK